LFTYFPVLQCAVAELQTTVRIQIKKKTETRQERHEWMFQYHTNLCAMLARRSINCVCPTE